MPKNNQIKKIIENILASMGIEPVNIEQKENQEIVIFDIETKDSPLLIGRGGGNLASLQHLTYILASKKMKEVPKFMLDVNYYRQDKKNKLTFIAKSSAEKVISRGQNELLKPMTSYERKIIHDMIAQYKELESTSIGEEPNRRVLIKIKK